MHIHKIVKSAKGDTVKEILIPSAMYNPLLCHGPVLLQNEWWVGFPYGYVVVLAKNKTVAGV